MHEDLLSPGRCAPGGCWAWAPCLTPVVSVSRVSRGSLPDRQAHELEARAHSILTRPGPLLGLEPHDQLVADRDRLGARRDSGRSPARPEVTPLLLSHDAQRHAVLVDEAREP